MITRTATDVEMKCAREACCRGEPCKRGAGFCDATDYLEMVRSVMRGLRAPTEEMMEGFQAASRQEWRAAIDIASPPGIERTQPNDRHLHKWRPYIAADHSRWSKCVCGEHAYDWPKNATHYMDDRGAVREVISVSGNYDFGWEKRQ